MKPGRLFLTPILVLFLVLHSCNTGKDEPRTEVPSVVTAVPSIPYATDQTSFHEANLRFRDQLNLAKNDIQRSQLVNECDKARTKFFKDKASRIDNWIGKIEDIKSENNGEWAFVKIASDAAGFPISYQTHFERWSEWGDKSLLKKGTRSFQQVAQLSVGETVRFSGAIIGSLYYKYSEDNSIDVESVRSPKIILKFDNITPFASESKE